MRSSPDRRAFSKLTSWATSASGSRAVIRIRSSARKASTAVSSLLIAFCHRDQSWIAPGSRNSLRTTTEEST